jgi:hypothetical protein
MRTSSFLFLFVVFASISSYADSSPTVGRDQALKRIDACLRRNEVSSRECKHLNEDVETLVGVYKGGDKTVLPTLFRFTYLTDFYGQALLSDPDSFLTAMARLPEQDQKAVTDGIAGGMWGLRNRERFEAIRALLTGIPDSSPTKKLSQACLKALERNNASFFVTYFPPQAFTGRAATLQLHWYSSDMYALGESPLWPPSATGETVYRLTYLPAFTGPTVVTLTVQPDGTGRITMKTVDGDRETIRLDESVPVPGERVAGFFAGLDQAHFWAMPAELPRTGLDGADWILEGVRDGKYHVAVRWCPDIDRKSADEAPFADAARLLFELAGHRRIRGC